MTINISTLLEVIRQGGTTALILGLVYVIWALIKGHLVPGYVYQQLKIDYQNMTKVAFRTTELGERVVKAIAPDKESEL